MEPNTFKWLWWDWLPAKRPGLRDQISEFIGTWRLDKSPERELAANLYFATALCRVRYLAVPQPLPAADDIPGLAAYWKTNYNTAAGKGRAADWEAAYRRYA